MSRTFDDKPAVREQVPLLVGLFGPSGSGKTYSALRLAQGMQTITGGEIFVLDTESKRALHYADKFKFRHIEFKPPFGSLDYLAALQYCAAKGAGVIVVDSMSHEHEGVGGYLMTQEEELERLSGGNQANRAKHNYSAWIRPAKERRQFINGVLQINANFIFCFRAKEKLKIKPGSSPVELGYMPIAGDEFLFEMGLNCLLMPGAYGVPTWQPERPGEQAMVKLPEQFRSLFSEQFSLDEEAGRQLAEWARGGAQPASRDPVVTTTAGPPAKSKREILFDYARTKMRDGRPAFDAWVHQLNDAQSAALSDIWDELQEIGGPDPADDDLGLISDLEAAE